MGRNWQPKYRVVCDKCGWTGKRTKRMFSKACPRCSHFRPTPWDALTRAIEISAEYQKESKP